MLEKLLGEEIVPAAADTFTDCSDIYALKAYAAGIVSGMGNKLFAPDAATNREQIACMLDSAIKYYEEKEGVSILRDTPELSGFTDIDKISSWALPSVSYLAGNGIMAGTSETELSPQAACTLEQSISFSLRTYKVVKLLDPNYSTIHHDLFNYVGYENYPFVPDLGKTFDLEGRALSQEELQRVVPSSDYQTPLEGYIYGPVSKEPAVFNLFTTCLKSFMFEQSFRLYYESDSTMIFRKTDDPDFYVGLYILEDSTIFLLTKNNNMDIDPDTIKCYPDFPDVPDYGALTGLEPIEVFNLADEEGFESESRDFMASYTYPADITSEGSSEIENQRFTLFTNALFLKGFYSGVDQGVFFKYDPGSGASVIITYDEGKVTISITSLEE
ncbi:MAG: S-layer homology domain-containing protein [Firmicutes bacterium]|nr:S-layer homology domain-containing protein [Bacillota bacterium]